MGGGSPVPPETEKYDLMFWFGFEKWGGVLLIAKVFF